MKRKGAFTLVELLVVMVIILILGGLILATSSYVQTKGKRSRAEAEIAAMSAALENYKADNGVYPRDPTPNTATDKLDARSKTDPRTVDYKAASLVLYRALSGDRNLDRVVNASDESFDIDGSSLSSPMTQLPNTYFGFRPNMLLPPGNAGTVTALGDPFASASFLSSYGYSTAYQLSPSTGYNPTFDLWSTAGETAAGLEAKWIKNW